MCDRVLHWCQPILRIGEIGALTYVIVYPSIVHCIEYINRLFVLLQTLCIGLIDFFNALLSLQGRRRFLKSGTAIERHRRFARAESTRRGEGTRWGMNTPFVRGVGGISPEKIFKFKMSVEAILMDFETMFACEIRLIVQAFHVAVFKRKGVRGISPRFFF